MAKAKLTPEEKKARRVARKAEKKRIAAERKRQLKIDELSREVKFGQLTIDKHEQNWKDMLMKISCENMRNDLEFAWHNFERAVDAKDYAISLLIDETKQSEEQQLINVRNHIENIDRLLGDFHKHAQEIRYDFEEQVLHLLADAKAETDKIMANFTDSEEYFRLMIAGFEEARRVFLTQTIGDYISRLNEERDRFADTTITMKTFIQIELDKIWDRMDGLVKVFDNQTRDRMTLYNAYCIAEAEMNKLLHGQRETIRKSTNTIGKTRLAYNTLVANQTLKKTELLHERQYNADKFWNMKALLSAESALDKKNLTHMSVESCTVIKYLEEITKLGEHILRMAATCRQYETQTEKVLAFPQDMAGDPLTDFNIYEFGFDCNSLRFFWQKIAQANCLRFSMQEEMTCLQKQNDLLKKQIHEYCQCMNCPPIKEAENLRLQHDDNLRSIVDVNDEIRKYMITEKSSTSHAIAGETRQHFDRFESAD